MSGLVLSLCDMSGVMVQPWADAGYECVCWDIEQDNPGTRDGVTYVRGDIFDIRIVVKPVFVAAFPPCTDLSGSGARWWPSKGIRRHIDALRVVERCLEVCDEADLWMLENPVGRLSQSIGKATFTFDPWEYGGYLDPPGDRYTKRTCIWSSPAFVVPPKRPSDKSEGSKMHLMPPSDERARLRSVTPAGFARAVFEANCSKAQAPRA